jgi:hypothetical protein
MAGPHIFYIYETSPSLEVREEEAYGEICTEYTKSLT